MPNGTSSERGADPSLELTDREVSIGRDIATLFIRWTFTRSALHRGWWLVTSLYLVIVADLTPFQLVFVGTAQNLIALLFETPTGVLADTISRKWSVVMAHVLMGTGMLVTGLVTAFPALVATQMLWGVAWAFSSGADVAWLTDELDDGKRVAGVLTASARWGQIGAAGGLIGFGALAWVTDLSTSIVAAGVGMLVLGVLVAVRFPERHFTPARAHRWRRSRQVFQRGVSLARSDRIILLVFAATILINGAAEAFDRLFPRRLLQLGLPHDPDPIVWLTMVGLGALGIAALALHFVQTRIDEEGMVGRVYAMACLMGALGMFVLALAPNDAVGIAGLLLVQGIAWPVTRCASVIWVNSRVVSEVRATVQSFLAQAEYVGEIFLGVGLGVVAQSVTISASMLGAGVLVAIACGLVQRFRERQAGMPSIRSQSRP